MIAIEVSSYPATLNFVEKVFKMKLCFASIIFFFHFNEIMSSQRAVISSNYIKTSDPQCLLEVQLTCTVQDLASLRWWFDGIQISSYVFFPSHTFPRDARNVPSEYSRIQIQIINATATTLDRFDATSVLIASASVLGWLRSRVANIQCGTNAIRSDTISTETLEQHALFPSPNVSACSFSSSNTVDLSIQWSPSFTSQHAVERYRVSVSPDPSSCSSDQVNSNQVYTCSGLVMGQTHLFIVSAINCAGQEGVKRNFSVTLNGPAPPSITKVSALYTGQSDQLTKVEVTWTQDNSLQDLMTLRGDVYCTSNLSRYWEKTVIALEGSFGTRVVKEFTVNSKICNMSGLFCSTPILVTVPDESYRLSASAVYITGEMPPLQHYFQHLSGTSSNLVNLNLWENEDSIVALCLVRNAIIATDCTIRYTLDPSYEYLSPSVTGPINEPFPVVSMNEIHPENAQTNLYFQVNITINSSLEVVVRENSTITIESRTLAEHVSTNSQSAIVEISILGVVNFLLITALIVCTGIVYWLCKKGKKLQRPEESPVPTVSDPTYSQDRKYVDLQTPESTNEPRESAVYELVGGLDVQLHDSRNTSMHHPSRNSMQINDYYHTTDF